MTLIEHLTSKSRKLEKELAVSIKAKDKLELELEVLLRVRNDKRLMGIYFKQDSNKINLLHGALDFYFAYIKTLHRQISLVKKAFKKACRLAEAEMLYYYQCFMIANKEPETKETPK